MSVRVAVENKSPALGEAFEEGVRAALSTVLTADATSFEDLPLSDRDAAWDAEAASQRWQDACGIGTADADWEKFRSGFFWYDPDKAETVGGYKLLFVDSENGKSVAVWRAITASAAAVQGARGGVDLPAADVEPVQAHIGAYYDKAEKEYDDDSIEPPWETPEEEKREDEAAVAAEFVAATPPTPTRTRETVDAPEQTAEDVALPDEHQPRDERPRRRPTPSAPQVSSPSSSQKWEAILAPEGKATDDGRIFAPGSISWRELPLTLMAMLETQEGHLGAFVAGRIDRIWRDDASGLIRGEGIFADTDEGLEVAKLVGDRVLTGNSVDLAIREYEVGARSDYVDDDGNWIGDDAREEKPQGEDDLLEVIFGDEPLIYVVRDAVIGMSTVCPFPAFADASIALAADGGREIRWGTEGDATTLRLRLYVSDAVEVRDGLTASAAGLAPDVPPADWFADPGLEELTPLTVTDDGRVYGHAAAWETCHIGLPGCTVAPTSDCDYAYFHLKEVVALAADGDEARVPCGTITLDTNHAARHLGRIDAAAHYDHTGTATADVVVGEDDHGIWVSGALRPDVDAATARKLRGAALSGDWRKVNGNLELVALLAVNVPGFPVPRAKALVAAAADGEAEVLSLVAAGIHDGRTIDDLTDEQRARLSALSARATGGLDALAELAGRAA